jgi:hypothetical protein
VDAIDLKPPADENTQHSVPSKPQSIFPQTLLDLLESPDEIEVMSIQPMVLVESEDGEGSVERPGTGPGFLHGYRIRGVARVPTADRRRTVAQALVTANREGIGWANCFDPHHAVRVSKGGQVAEMLICFWCGNVKVIGPGTHAAMCPIGFGSSAKRVLQRELRRGGVGWLWFWRRWFN